MFRRGTHRCNTFMCARHEPLLPTVKPGRVAGSPGTVLSRTSVPTTPSMKVILRPLTAAARVRASCRSVREGRLMAKICWN